MKDQNVQQTRLARAVGCSSSHIANILGGINFASQNCNKKICAMLRLDTKAMGTLLDQEKAVIQATKKSPIRSLWGDLNEENRNSVTVFASTLLQDQHTREVIAEAKAATPEPVPTSSRFEIPSNFWASRLITR